MASAAPNGAGGGGASASAASPAAAMEAALLQVLQPDTSRVREGEAALGAMLKKRASTLHLTVLLRTSPHVGVRHLAAVLLRNRVVAHWIHISDRDRAEIRSQLLQATTTEPNRLVRLNACYVVASLARNLMAVGKSGWPELLEGISVLTKAADPALREVGFVLLYAMSETVAATMTDDFPALCALFKGTLAAEADPKVQTASLRAASALMGCVSDDDVVMTFQSLVPDMISAIVQGSFEDEVLAQILDGLSALATAPVPILDPFAPSLVEALSRMITSPKYSPSTRAAASVALTELVAEKPRVSLKTRAAMDAVVQAVIHLGRLAAAHYHTTMDDAVEHAPPDPNQAGAGAGGGGGGGEEGGDEEEEDMPPGDMLEFLVDALAQNVPGSKIAEPLLGTAAQLMAKDRPVMDRVAGALILIVATEGLADELRGERKAFPVFLGLLLDLLATQGATSVETDNCRRAALVCFGQWAEVLKSDITEKHALVLPPTIQLLAAPNVRVRRAAHYVLSTFSPCMEPEELVTYDDPLVKLLFNAVISAPTPHAAADAIESLSNYASAVSERFLPHLPDAMRLAAELLSLTEERLVPARKSATEFLANLLIVAEACYPNDDNPYAADVPEMLNRAFTLPVASLSKDGVADLMDSAMVLSAHVAIALGRPRVDALLPALFTRVLEACAVFNEDDLERVVVDLDNTAAAPDVLKRALGAGPGGPGGPGGAGDEDEDEDVDDNSVEDFVPGRRVTTHVRKPAADFKCAALFALESMAQHGSPHVVAPFFGDIVAVAEKALNYSHPSVRAAGVGALATASLALRPEGLPLPDPALRRALALCTHTESDLALNWLPGQVSPAGLEGPFHEAMVNMVQRTLGDLMLLDDDKEVAAACCDALNDLIKNAGPDVLVGGGGAVFLNALTRLMAGKAACQSEVDRVDAGSDEGAGEARGARFARGRDRDQDGGGAEDYDELDEERRHDEVLVDSAADALAMVVKAMGPGGFKAEHAKQVLPTLIAFSRASMPVRDQVTGSGCLCQIIQALTWNGAAVALLAPFATKLHRIAARCAGNTVESNLRRNGIFMLGVMADAGLLSEAQCVESVRAVRAAFDHAKKGEAATGWEMENLFAVMDNACSTVARLLLRLAGTPALPPAHVDAVARGLAEALPLRFDQQEAWVCFDALLRVAPQCSPETRGLMKACAQAALADATVAEGVAGTEVIPELLRL